MSYPIGIVGLAGSGKDTVANMITKILPEYKRYAYADPLKEFTKAVFGLTDYEVYDVVGKEKQITLRLPFAVLRSNFHSAFVRITNTYMKATKQFPQITVTDAFDIFRNVLLSEVRIDNFVFDLVFRLTSKLATGNSDYIRFTTTPRKLLQLLGTEFFRNHIDKNFWVSIAPTTNIVVPDVRFMNEVDHVQDQGGIIIKVVDPNLKEIRTSSHSSEDLARQDIEGAYIIHNNKNKGLTNLEHKVNSLLSSLRQ